MAVPAGPTEIRYVGNGVTTVFAIPFLVIQAADLAVYLDGVRLSSGYIQSGVGNPTSSVTFSVAPVLMAQILFALEVPFERLNDYQENGDFLSSTVNRDFDRIWQALKQLLRGAGRALTLGAFDVDGQGWYRAKENGIRDLRDPVEPQDAATLKSVGDLISKVQGPINNSSNVLYLFPDGSPRVVQDLATNLGASGTKTSRGNTSEFELTSLYGAMKDAGIFDLFAQDGAADILNIGDSLGAGVGQPNGFVGGYMARVARSLMNAFDKSPGTDRGYMYFTWLNAYQQLLSEGGWSQSGGSPVAGGPAGNAWRMPSGAWAEKTGVEAWQGRLYFAPSTDGSTMQVTVNGDVFANITVNSSGFSANFNLVSGGGYIKTTDVVRFTCTSGSIDVYGFRLMRAGGSHGPIVYCSPEGSQTFADYTETTRSALLAGYVNADQPSAPKLICCFLGTNDMITAVGKQKPPAAMVADMQTFVTRYRTLFPGCSILFWVPPRPRADVVLPYGPYENYVTAMADFVASQSLIGLVRMDLSGIEGADLYSPDGFHLNSAGHAAAAKKICDYLGISVDTSAPGFERLPDRIAVTPGVNWTSNAISTAITASSGGVAAIYGSMSKGAGGTVAIGQVSVAHTPIENTFFLAIDQAGVARTVMLTASTRTLSLVDAAALPSVLALNFSGNGYRT
ncbi:SGNH/GDSL hydrolase family protein [Pseudomonas protegens]|uniref:SGNH/GDSL hydrolase family protein n=1 Tax=Pseudomonas protegens TaxID=380021 RepID=UPI003FD8E4EC